MKTLKFTLAALVAAITAALAIAAGKPNGLVNPHAAQAQSAIVSGQNHLHGARPEGSPGAGSTETGMPGCHMSGMASGKLEMKGDHPMGCCKTPSAHHKACGG